MENAFLCGITKNEGIDLAEWILFHLFIGFKKIIVYDNNSIDNINIYINECKKYGDVEYIIWPRECGQLSAYEDCLKRFGKKCDWMAFLDIDEFLLFPKDRHVGNFLKKVSNYKAIAINWRVFGSSNQKTITKNLVTTTFLYRAPNNFSANRHIKSMVRPNAVSKVINPHYLRLKRKSFFSFKRFEYFSPEGEIIEWIKLGKSKKSGENSIAVINHYFTKSHEHYMKKLQRGNADKKQLRQNVFDFNDRNDIYDNQINDIYFLEIKKIKLIIEKLLEIEPIDLK